MDRTKYWYGDALLRCIQDGLCVKDAAGICNDLALFRSNGRLPYETKEGFYDRAARRRTAPRYSVDGDETDGNNDEAKGLIIEIAKAWKEFIELQGRVMDKVRQGYAEMRAKVTSSSSSDAKDFEAEFATLQQTAERAAGKLKMAEQLLEKQDKALKQKESQLKELHERIDNLLENQLRRNMGTVGSVSYSGAGEQSQDGWVPPYYVPKVTRKAGTDVFNYDRYPGGLYPESVEHIDLAGVIAKISRKNEFIETFPGEH